jgi:hypothetical protein
LGIPVDLARRLLADRIPAGTVEIVRREAAPLPLPDGTFSVVACMGSFEAFVSRSGSWLNWSGCCDRAGAPC